MFDKEKLEELFAALRSQYGSEPDWEQILRDAHLGVARSDAGVSLGDIDSRVAETIEKHKT